MNKKQSRMMLTAPCHHSQIQMKKRYASSEYSERFSFEFAVETSFFYIAVFLLLIENFVCE